MLLNAPTLVTVALVVIGGAIAAPVLAKGFGRRGTGVKYEQNFLIQRAPQYASLLNVVVVVVAFLAYNGILHDFPLAVWFAQAGENPNGQFASISWLGIPILASGLVFMVGGWYWLGEFFSTDAELMDDHKVKNDGLFRYVMHPIYSGIIQCLLGSSIAATSVIGVCMCALVVAPLWLRRAKYEERLLIENLGQEYKDYAEQTKWRRLVPTFIPIGV